jgi:4-diphosphocytidyl-2-C-methyl-D-erythritol kinase
MRLFFDAYAKINLYLEVVGKRPDGYHDLVTVMQSISLSDRLTFKKRKTTDVSLSVTGPVSEDRSNLVIRAAEAYFSAAGECFGADIHLQKRIPVSAGLGGGSADAAATLKGLNALNGMRFDEKELVDIAAGIGADVPFCLVGGTRLCRGIGEKMTVVPNQQRLALVVSKFGEGISTPGAFAALDQKYNDFRGCVQDASPDVLLSGLANGDVSHTVSGLFNRFESVIEPMRPAVAVLKQHLTAAGALAVQMSGSGPAVFGVFADDASAERAASTLLKMGISAFPCHTVLNID